jgi:predicted house-cleaning noncanonical NTP pyrophosphatase (MazG superfamily)
MAKKPAKKPTTLTEKHIKAICASIRLGSPFSVAASCAGISRRTLYNWRQQGKKQKSGIHRHLIEEMEKADNDFIANNLRALAVHTAQNWQTAAWLLERRHPEHFAKPSDRRELEELRRELELIRSELIKTANQGGA